MPAWAQGYAVLGTNLFGDNVPGGGAGRDAVGNFDGEIDLAQDQLCYFFELEGLDDANSAHIHHAREGESGPVVLTLPLPTADAGEVCVMLDKALLQSMADQPADYYADVHSAGKPDGALRGQFGG